MKLAYKLICGHLLVATIASSATYFALRSYENIDSAFDRLMDDPLPTLKALNDLKQSGNQIIDLTHEAQLIFAESQTIESSTRYILLANKDRQLEILNKNYDEALKNYMSVESVRSEAEKEYLKSITQSGSRILKESAEIINLKKRGIVGEEILKKQSEFSESERLFYQAIDNARKYEHEQLSGEQAIVLQTISNSTKTTLIVTLLTFISATALGLYISNSIARRVTKLKTASEKVGHGELETIIEVESSDELGDLTRSFNKMTSELKESHAELSASENFVNNIVTSIADSLIVVDIGLKIIRINQAALSLTGYSEDELLSQSIKILRQDGSFFDERDAEELYIKGCISGIETLWQTKDSREVSVLFSASVMHDTDGIANGIVCVAQDITVRKSLENQLTHQALHDPLTKLANRVLFRNRVEHALARVDRNHEPVAVLFLDLDNFKTVNDTLGHDAGDALLISVAERLTACLRASDTIARLGGDEFAILAESIHSLEEVTLIAERLNDILRTPFTLEGKEMLVRTSIGIAISAGKHENIEDLLRNADVAMYKAKSLGKDGYVMFETKMREDLLEQVEFEADLRRAIERREFVLHYQPIINLQTEEMIGMEALVRWNHPERGLISPDKFIPVAEETGLIVPLGQWILEEACRQARSWQIEFNNRQNLSITVNLSNKQIQEESLVRVVASALSDSGLSANHLILEITENTMLQETESVISKLNELKDLGVKLAIDDFGTGYSSLSYLQRFPIDVLKIDKSFIDKLNQGREGAAVARAIITMSETLHLKTIAEGIETINQNSVLQSLGCEFGQGYHFSKPLNREDMRTFLEYSRIPVAKSA
jgi:diguanylate cyclase (GGDEF)-like protein/PAS domain S-box-containing protein